VAKVSVLNTVYLQPPQGSVLLFWQNPENYSKNEWFIVAAGTTAWEIENGGM
jgi:hypothetical protein